MVSTCNQVTDADEKLHLPTSVFFSFFLEMGSHCGRSVEEELRERCKGGGEVGLIRLVTDTTYCIEHKSSYPPNLSFKQIILGGDASAVSLLTGGGGVEKKWREGEMVKGRGSDGGL